MSLTSQFYGVTSVFPEANVSDSVSLSVPHLNAKGSSLNWLFRDCCHRHWWSVAEWLGTAPSALTDMRGGGMMASLSIANLHSRPDHFREDDVLQIELTTDRPRVDQVAARAQSDITCRLAIGAMAVGTGVAIAAFSAAVTELQMSIFQVFGVLGAGLFVLSYSLLQFRILSQHERAYSTLNLVAASLVALSLVEAFNLATAIIQSVWIALSLVGLFKAATRT